MGKLSYNVRPGGLSDQDRQTIFELAQRGWKTGPIARKLGKDPGTVRWFMYRNGLAQPVARHAMPTQVPNAAGRKGYTAEEDSFLLERRAAGVDLRTLAQEITAKFGHRRSRHGVEVRLTMIVNRDELAA